MARRTSNFLSPPLPIDARMVVLHGPDEMIKRLRLDQLREAIEAGARSVLLDNFTPEGLGEAVAIAREAGVGTEASGSIRLETIGAYADSGVDFISLGALTHTTRPMDISLQVVPEALSGP